MPAINRGGSHGFAVGVGAAILISAGCVLILVAIISAMLNGSSSLATGRHGISDWQVKRVGGMALDAQNSNVYLTSSAVDATNPTTGTRCLIRMLSFSPKEGFGSLKDHSMFPKLDDGEVMESYVCPRDPRCMVRRRHLEEFQQVDETVYPEKCSRIYIHSNQVIVLGRLPQERVSSGAPEGSVLIMSLNPNKIGGNDTTHEFRPQEEPFFAAFDDGDNNIIYLVSHSRRDPLSIVHYRYSFQDGKWQEDWKSSHKVTSTYDKVRMSSLNAILGGQYLVSSGTITHRDGHTAGDFGIYHAKDGEILGTSTNGVLLDAQADKQSVECVCYDERESDASVAILYRVSILVIKGKTLSLVQKLRLVKDSLGTSLHQTVVWTQEMPHASIKECQVVNHSLVLVGFAHSDSTSAPPALVISKRFTSNGEPLWTSQQSTYPNNTTSKFIRPVDIAMDQQDNVLVYGQVENDGEKNEGDIVLLQALGGADGAMLAQTNSPPMVVEKRSSGRTNPLPRTTLDIMSREDFLANYQVPLIIILVALGVSLIVCVCVIGTAKENAKENEKASFKKRIMHVFLYLRPFEAKEVDLQQSPTGGFNATYTDELMKKMPEDGNNNKEDSKVEPETRPLSSQL